MQEPTTQTEPTTQPESDNTAVQLQLSDLLMCAQALQLASTRGAFRAEEFTQIGGVFDRITAFLKASGAIASSSAPTSDETVTSPVAE
jgi:hypothetical protein